VTAKRETTVHPPPRLTLPSLPFIRTLKRRNLNDSHTLGYEGNIVVRDRPDI
jgi:hypothetical protein